jgi:hypothetical protein
VRHGTPEQPPASPWQAEYPAAVPLSPAAETPFDKGPELDAAREAHKRVQRQLIAKGPEIPAEQRPFLDNAMRRQRNALEKIGFGDALREFLGQEQRRDAEAEVPKLYRRALTATASNQAAPELNLGKAGREIARQLAALERFADEHIRAYATLIDEFYGTLAARTGEDGRRPVEAIPAQGGRGHQCGRVRSGAVLCSAQGVEACQDAA